MAEAFSFPPPPPPPPRQAATTIVGPYQSQYPNHYGNNSRGRGRGTSFGGGRARHGRGRGTSTRGRGHDFYGNESGNTGSSQYPTGQGQSYGPRVQNFQGAPSGHKRPFSAAFDRDPRQAPRPQAAPAVPSFGGDISALPMKRLTSPTNPRKKFRTHNQLGLTPANQDTAASSDEDEEATLAMNSDITQSDGLKFEYRGNNTTLNSAAEIAVWIAERKKRYPTAARAEAVRSAAEEKRRSWEAEKKAAREQKEWMFEKRKAEREELRRKTLASVAAKKEKALQGSQTTVAGSHSIAPSKGLRGAVSRSRDFKTNQEAITTPTLVNGSTPVTTAAIPTTSDNLENHPPPTPSDFNSDSDLISSTDTESDYTSSSGASTSPNLSEDEPSSSSSDSDLAPEELSTKHPPPLKTLPPPSSITLPPPSSITLLNPPSPSHCNPQPTPRICRNLLQRGRCPFGTRCRYSHVRNPKHTDQSGRSKAGRGKGRGKDGLPAPPVRAWNRGLYGIMVADEEAAQRRNAVGVVMAMGEAGMFGDASGDGGGKV